MHCSCAQRRLLRSLSSRRRSRFRLHPPPPRPSRGSHSESFPSASRVESKRILRDYQDMIRPVHRCIIVATLALAFLSACSEVPQKPAAKFTGRLILLTGDDTHGVFEARPNPDQSQLLFATKDEIALRDVHTSAVKSLVKGQTYCLAWSPDGKRFSYKERQPANTKLYVSDLDGKTKLIWEDSSGIERTGATYCAQWVAPDRIVFDRFVGMIPKQAVSESLKPNTTTVATVGESVKFADGERKWSVQGICPGGNVLLSPADQAQPIVIAKTTDRFEK